MTLDYSSFGSAINQLEKSIRFALAPDFLDEARYLYQRLTNGNPSN